MPGSGTPTTNHGLPRFDGDLDFGDQIDDVFNSAMATLDVVIPIRGSGFTGSRPAAGMEGTFWREYAATLGSPTVAIYYDTGTVWIQVWPVAPASVSLAMLAADVAAGETPRVVGAGGEPAYATNWGIGDDAAKFYKQLGRVRMLGSVLRASTTATAGAAIFQLPATGVYRPLATRYFPCTTFDGSAWSSVQVQVTASGNVAVKTAVPAGTYIFLDSIDFKAEQ